MTEEEIIARYSTPGLKKNQLTREIKKLIMTFDGQYSNMTKQERDEFLDKHFPVTHDPVRPD
jgi:hypothetical protein